MKEAAAASRAITDIAKVENMREHENVRTYRKEANECTNMRTDGDHEHLWEV